MVLAPVAQLDRAPDYESGGRRFESCRVYHLKQPRLSEAGLFAWGDHATRPGTSRRFSAPDHQLQKIRFNMP